MTLPQEGKVMANEDRMFCSWFTCSSSAVCQSFCFAHLNIQHSRWVQGQEISSSGSKGRLHLSTIQFGWFNTTDRREGGAICWSNSNWEQSLSPSAQFSAPALKKWAVPEIAADACAAQRCNRLSELMLYKSWLLELESDRLAIVSRLRLPFRTSYQAAPSVRIPCLLFNF